METLISWEHSQDIPIASKPKMPWFSKFLGDFKTFSTTNSKQCLLDYMGFIVQ